jgi:hypothetical protein
MIASGKWMLQPLRGLPNGQRSNGKRILSRGMAPGKNLSRERSGGMKSIEELEQDVERAKDLLYAATMKDIAKSAKSIEQKIYKKHGIKEDQDHV